jgi:hypothetical protein
MDEKSRMPVFDNASLRGFHQSLLMPPIATLA